MDVRIPAQAGSTYANKAHKMSGSFLATQVIDEINQGKFVTQVKLMISPLVQNAGKDNQTDSSSSQVSGYPIGSGGGGAGGW